MTSGTTTRFTQSIPSSFLNARLKLARLGVDDPTRLDRVLEHVTRLASEQLTVERVGLWLFDEAHETLSLYLCYTRSTQSFSRELQSIRVEKFPDYFAALEERRALVADDVATHAATKALADLYLTERGVTSMLDVPIFRHGTTAGVLCHEHIGEPRAWGAREVDFAASVADMIAIYSEEADAARTQLELRKQEEELQQAERLATIGVVARHVAHDINNAVAPIMICAAQLKPLVASDPNAKERLAIIINAAEHGAALARRLLDAAAGHAPVRHPVTVDPLVEDAAPLLSAILGETRSLTLALDAAEARVSSDSVEMVRILVNLVTNARDAMTDGGSVTISTVVVLDEVRISVADTGTGMSEDLKKRLFTPFFTTKPGKGTGLGLAGVRSAIEAMKGKIQIESSPGNGTTVTLRLPRVQ